MKNKVGGFVEKVGDKFTGKPKIQKLNFNHNLKSDKRTDVGELKRQIKRQENAYNKILKEEGVDGLKKRVKNYSPELEKEGRRRVKSLKKLDKGKVRLHEPDMRTGGKPDDITGVGASRENSIIGGNATRIAKEILKFPDNTVCVKCTLKLIKPNVVK